MMTNVTDDSVLLGVAILERVRPFLNIGTREPISKVGVERVQDSIGKCVEKIAGKITNSEVLTALLEVDTLITTVLSEQTFVETDDAVKDIIVGKLMPAVDLLYKEAGMYYVDHNFTFKPGLEGLLIRIVDKSIEQGFYFGYEEKI
jgi:hypothetical protein